MPIFIETPRLILRHWKEVDHEHYVQLSADKKVMEYFPSVLSRDESLEQIKRITTHIDEYGYGLLAVERKDNSEFIGYTGLSHPGFESDFTPCVEIGWRLSKPNWNYGFATEAAKACLEYGLGTLKLGEIYSWTSVHNTRSEQVMIKIGMEKQGFFEHPLINDGHILKSHVIYKRNSTR